MNPTHGQDPQQAPAQEQPGAAGQQPRPTPMYQPNQIRSLPMLSEEEMSKYEQGLKGLWTKVNSSPANSPEQVAARQKIIEFSKMLLNKIQARRTQAQQQQQEGAPARPSSAQSNTTGQASGTPTTTQQKPQATSQGSQGQATAASTAGPTQTQNPQPGAAAAAGGTMTGTKIKAPDHIVQQVNKLTFYASPNKHGAEAAKFIQELKEKYARAIYTIDINKAKAAGVEKVFKERADAGRPLQNEELRQYQNRKETFTLFYSEAQKWMDTVHRQQAVFLQAHQQQAGAQASQSGTAAATAAPSAPSAAQNNSQAATQNVTASVNAAVEAAKTQQNLANVNRPSPANGTSTPTPAQSQPRPVPQPAQQPQGQAQAKPEQPHPPPVNTAQAQAAALGQATARVQTPQSTTPATAGGPTRALSHSAAMNLANQRAASTPSSTPGQGQAAASGAGVGGAVNQGAVVPGAVQQQQPQPQPQLPPPPPQQQQQQGHPHAHPTQTQTGFQAKMPIPKQLPEKATAVPQGVTVGGGVAAGRPTMSQGSGTLGGVMNQPPVARIPAYSHDAEGDHILSKKKLDELVRQVCGGSGDSLDGNLLTPEVEESILSMADAFVDTVLNSACRNAKERGSRMLEIRDIQLVLERGYNIRVPGYSSDELRTVRKVQPSPGWIAKMSAVQAAKVMPGKGDS